MRERGSAENVNPQESPRDLAAGERLAHTDERLSNWLSVMVTQRACLWLNGRGDAKPDSDIDILVEVEYGRTLLDVIALEQDLEELLGRSVEVLTDAGLSPYLQQRILIEAAAL
jgi:hypothetical protein